MQNVFGPVRACLLFESEMILLDVIRRDEKVADESASHVSDGASLQIKPLSRLIAGERLGEPPQLVKRHEAGDLEVPSRLV